MTTNPKIAYVIYEWYLVGQIIQNGQSQQRYNGVEYQCHTVDIELYERKENGLCIRGGNYGILGFWKYFFGIRYQLI